LIISMLFRFVFSHFEGFLCPLFKDYSYPLVSLHIAGADGSIQIRWMWSLILSLSKFRVPIDIFLSIQWPRFLQHVISFPRLFNLNALVHQIFLTLVMHKKERMCEFLLVWGRRWGGQYIESSDLSVEAIIFMLRDVKNKTIPVNEVIQDLRQKTEEFSLPSWKSHAERAGLVNCNPFKIGDSLEILRTVHGNVSEIGIRNLCIKKVERHMSCVKNKCLVDVSYVVVGERARTSWNICGSLYASPWQTWSNISA